MFFYEEVEFCSKNFITSLLTNSVFLPSEAWLSLIMQNWKKSLSFHDCLPKVVTNFECLLLNLHPLNYHIERGLIRIGRIKKFVCFTVQIQHYFDNWNSPNLVLNHKNLRFLSNYVYRLYGSKTTTWLVFLFLKNDLHFLHATIKNKLHGFCNVMRRIWRQIHTYIVAFLDVDYEWNLHDIMS